MIIYMYVFYIYNHEMKKCVVLSNVEELLIKEYYRKYLPKSSYGPNNIYEKEILNNYSNIYSQDR
jgi:hypothetical protein